MSLPNAGVQAVFKDSLLKPPQMIDAAAYLPFTPREMPYKRKVTPRPAPRDGEPKTAD
jgi:hypothetical protein